MKKLIVLALFFSSLVTQDASACLAWAGGTCCPSGYVFTGKTYQCDLSFAGPQEPTAGCGCSKAPSTSSTTSTSGTTSTGASSGYVCEPPSSSTSSSSSVTSASSSTGGCAYPTANDCLQLAGSMCLKSCQKSGSCYIPIAGPPCI